VSILGGVALGAGAVSDRAIAPASGSIIVGTNVIPYNTTDRNLLGAVSVGNATDFRQITNLADGTQDQDAVSLRQLKGAMSSFSVTPISLLHTNSAATDSAAIGAESVAIGPQTTVNGDNGIGLGNGAIVQQTAPGGTAIGQTATVNLADGVALGTNATSNGIQAMALGAGTQAAFAGSVALGAGSVTDAAVGTASYAIAGTTYNFTGTTPGSTVSVGAPGAERTITNVAAGRISGGSTDAINGSQLYAATQAIDALNTSVVANAIHYYSVNDGGTQQSNYANNGATGVNSVASGPGTLAAGVGSVAMGHNSQVQSGTGAVAIGEGQTVNGDGAVAIGDPNTVSGTGAVGMGANNTVNGNGAVALGNGNNAQGVGSVALGNASSALAAGAVAFGNAATANNANDVALGSGSTTTAAVGTANTVINGTTYAFAGTNPTSTVSVGSVGNERTVTNVAAGRISGSSTDAINGSQLFQTNQALNTVGNTVTNLGDSIANSYGGSTTYDPTTGTLNTSITYAGNTYSSLQQIFNQISGVVDGAGIKYFHANSTLADSQPTGTNSVAIGPVSNATTTDAVSIGNGATAGANVGDVALGAGSTTGTVVQTGSGTIDGNTYTYAGATPTSTVSVGAPGAERTITNVAAGQVNGGSTDAVNGSQLFATNQAVENLSSTVTANATHYYSVNDGGTQGGNYANNGATGANALAAGVGASATAASGTALGQNTGVSVLGGVALGSGAVSDRAIAPTSGSILVGTNVIPYNTTDRNLLGAVSVGNTTDFRQITNVADGTLDQDAVTLRQLKGAMSSFSVTPIKYFHANSTASDSLAAGAESVAVGPQTTVNGDNGVGIGNGAIVQQTAPGGTAIGQNATVNLADGVALGTNATSNGIQAMALGAGTQAAFAGSVALGAGSVTDAAVGTASTTLAGTTYNFAGTTPGSTVSVGAVGAERTLTNVAAGRISGSSTDAINGSQLYATNQTLQQLYTSLQNLTTTVNNLPSQGPGNGTTINTYQTSVDNTKNATATGSNSTAVGAGSTATADNSVAIGANSVANTANTVSVGSVGNERTITNVAAGTNATDAVNVGQLNEAIESAKNWSKDYVDQRFQTVDRDLNRIGNRANAGIASAMAMASLPQAYQPNQSSAAVAVGTFHGESGVAVGVSTITESGRYVFKLNATTNSRGDTGAGVGAGVVW